MIAIFLSVFERRKRLTNSSVKEDFPAPPVPVIPMIGILNLLTSHQLLLPVQVFHLKSFQQQK
jgi:hypothetical protein